MDGTTVWIHLTSTLSSKKKVWKKEIIIYIWNHCSSFSAVISTCSNTAFVLVHKILKRWSSEMDMEYLYII